MMTMMTVNMMPTRRRTSARRLDRNSWLQMADARWRYDQVADVRWQDRLAIRMRCRPVCVTENLEAYDFSAFCDRL